jgi:prephenate dehydrogenase
MKVAVVGPGLIGRSVALAVRRAYARVQIVEIDRGDSLKAAANADVIVLATPVDVILETIQNEADVLRGAVTIDTGSTKRLIVAAARAAGLDRFVGGHPMAGGSLSGPSAARAEMFDGRQWFLVRGAAQPDAWCRAQEFVAMLGARPIAMDDDGAPHDRLMAAVSHLPQAVASALMIVAAEAAGEQLSWAGAGLRDTTRLAESSAAMWEPILAGNADELRPLLLQLAASLTSLAHELSSPEHVRALFSKANRYRALL